MQRRGLADEPDEPVVLPHVARHPGGEGADALRVLGRVVVAVLRREREPPERVDADRLRVAERAQRLAGHDGLQLAEPAAHRPVLEHEREPAHARVAERRPSVVQLVDRHDRRAGVEPERVQPRAARPRRRAGQREDHLGLRRGRLDRDEVEHRHEVHGRAPGRAELRAEALGRLPRAADDQHTSARERAVIHTAT